MIIKFVVPALVLATASASASAAQTDSRTAGAKPAAAAGAKANKICIKVAPMTGSRFEKLECKTRQDWARDGVDIDEMLK